MSPERWVSITLSRQCLPRHGWKVLGVGLMQTWKIGVMMASLVVGKTEDRNNSLFKKKPTGSPGFRSAETKEQGIYFHSILTAFAINHSKSILSASQILTHKILITPRGEVSYDYSHFAEEALRHIRVRNSSIVT